MICDNCRESIEGAVITKKNGEKWCHKCARIEERKPKNPKLTKTKDPFVKVARRIANVHRGHNSMSEVILRNGSGRVYTNGMVLLTEMSKTPKSYKLLSLDHLWELPKAEYFGYPPIEKLLNKSKEEQSAMDRMLIPEDFYQYAKVFNTSKPYVIRVKLRRGEITIIEPDDGTELHYRELATTPLAEADYDLRYFMALRPEEIAIFGSDPAWVFHSYDPGVEACESVLLMPMDKKE